MFNKHALLLGAALCTVFTSAHATKDKPGEEGTYTRPGTNLVIKSEKDGDKPSPAVQQLLEENKELLAPTVDLKTLKDHFDGGKCHTPGPVGKIFDLYDTPNPDLTVAEEARKLLPADHVLSVHTFQGIQTEEGQAAIMSQCSESSNGVPTNFTGSVKYQRTDGNELIKVSAVFDLTGSKKPTLSVVRNLLVDEKTGKELPEKVAFEKEIQALGAGVKHVAVYAAGDIEIPTITKGKKDTAKAVSRTIKLKD